MCSSVSSHGSGQVLFPSLAPLFPFYVLITAGSGSHVIRCFTVRGAAGPHPQVINSSLCAVRCTDAVLPFRQSSCRSCCAAAVHALLLLYDVLSYRSLSCAATMHAVLLLLMCRRCCYRCCARGPRAATALNAVSIASSRLNCAVARCSHLARTRTHHAAKPTLSRSVESW